MSFTVTTEYEVSCQQVADLMVTALEGGSDHWINQIRPAFKTYKESSLGSNYGPDMIARTFDPGEDQPLGVLNPENIRKGLQIMATDYARHFSDILNDNMDADTADVFLQCVLFGDVIYG